LEAFSHHDDYPAALDKASLIVCLPLATVPFSSFFLPHLTSELRQAQLKPLTKVPAGAAGSLKENHRHHRHHQLVSCLEMIAKGCAMS
jgi:hypothetical protein